MRGEDEDETCTCTCKSNSNYGRYKDNDDGRASLCKKGCYTVLYNACIHVLCTRYTRVIHMCITLRMDTLYTVVYNNYSITSV